MLRTKNDITSKIHLVISVIIVIPTALLYGFQPNLQFELYPNTTDEHNFFKAVMGLYLGFSFLWILGILKTNYWKAAVMSNIVFMLGLGGGRFLSMITDGIPTFGYQFGMVAELFLGCYGAWVLQKFENNK